MRDAQHRRTAATTRNTGVATTTGDNNDQGIVELGFSEVRFTNYNTRYSSATNAPTMPGSS